MTSALLQWQRERFPLRNGIFFTLFHFTALFVGRSAAGGSATAHWRDLPGLAAVWAFFLMLRVFDEHKDFAADAVAHPDRALQRGLVTLPQLARIGILAAALQLGVSLWLDGGIGAVTLRWVVVLVWSLLMMREFFVAQWLRAHLIPYAVSHMLVMPLVAIWIVAMASAGAARMPALAALSLFAFFSPLAFEVARKLRAPDDEHPLADSYSQSLGSGPAALLLAVVVTAAAGASLLLVQILEGRVPLAGAVFLTIAVAAAAVASVRYAAHPTRPTVKLAELATAVATLGAHVVLLVVLGWGRSVR